MPNDQAKTYEGTTEEPDTQKKALSTNTAKYEIPYSPGDALSLKITIEIELRPSAQRRVTTSEHDKIGSLSTEGGAHGEKEADRSYNSPMQGHHQVGSRSTEGGAHGEKEADRSYVPPRK